MTIQQKIAASKPQLHKTANVLIVDDMAEMSRLMKDIIKAAGLPNVHQAQDGMQALEMLRVRPYDLVLSDWRMKPMSGIELLKEIRSDARLQSVYFIMVSCINDLEHVAAAKQHGANDYLIKPFTVATMRKKLGPLFAT